ncbi:hypothetical protein PO909_025630 [Leuciscus waleckii]
MVKLERSWKPTSTTCGELTFLPRNDGTNDHLLQPQSGTQDKKMKLFSSGKMSLTATTDKTGYMQGETINIFVDIDNSSSCDGKLKYSLIQQQMFLAGRTTKRKLRYIVHETKDCIPSGEKQTFIVNLKIPRDLTVTTENCRIINVQYQLKIQKSNSLWLFFQLTNNVLPDKANLGDSSHIRRLSLTSCPILVDNHLHMQNFIPI